MTRQYALAYLGMAMWLSNDARRLPVRIEAQLVVGKFTLILRQVTGR